MILTRLLPVHIFPFLKGNDYFGMNELKINQKKKQKKKKEHFCYIFWLNSGVIDNKRAFHYQILNPDSC